MKYWKQVLATAALAVTLAGCGWVAPDAGQEGVLVKKPWFFGHGGVDSDPVSTGRSVVAWSTQVVYVNIVPQTIEEPFEDIMSSDGVPLSFDGYVKLKITDSVLLVKKFSGSAPDIQLDPQNQNDTVPAWYYNNIQGPIRNVIRDAVKKHGLNETAISYTANAAIESEVRAGISAYLNKTGIPVVLVDFTLGKANPPPLVLQQRVRTAEEQQRIITERQTKLAEDARLLAEQSRAKADNVYRESMDLSPEQFIELQRINMQKDACGKNNCTFISGANVNPVIGVH